ncbi:MAG: ComEC family competence protein [Variibacter sp.]|nr:ComEC family competence protein [Variibacter sp.]
MAERGRAGGRVAPWPQDVAARARRAAPRLRWRLADAFAPMVARLAAWAAAEAGAGRFVPWLTVFFGAGSALYFAADREPALWAVTALFVASGLATVALRRHGFGFALAALATAASAGFAVATARSLWIAHPVLSRPLFGVALTGWVEVREERERTDRIVLALERMEGGGLPEPLARVRISVRKGTAPPAGSFVRLKARLSPPLAPLRPGGYDFARDLYFQNIGATGFALGKIERLDPPGPPPARLRFAAAVAGARDAIDARIRAALPGDIGAIASALITGKRDAISAPVNEAMYVSSLAHVLSISGFHMAVVAGVVFFAVRGLLALSAALALRRPIKKWAAAAALIAATGYLVLSGAEVATQRAYVMTAIVLIGVMVDRAALTLRTLAVAAFGVLLLAPEAVVHPSFQMSFAATLALVAAYERGLPWMSPAADTPLSARIALWGGRELANVLLASTVAGLATTLFAAYHFHRFAPYGLVANLLAMPVVSAWVMPMGLIALVALPFGFDDGPWRLMGLGVEWLTSVALWVASLPGAVGRVAAFGVGPLLVATAGLLLLCLLRSPLRLSGLVLIVAGAWTAAHAPRPDVMVAPGGEAVAVRGAAGRLAILQIGRDTFTVREWLAADADARTPGDPGLRDGFACDEIGCTAPLADGTMVAVVLAAEAFEEDCRRAALIVSRRSAPPDCAAVAVDRNVWSRAGALALFRHKDGWTVAAARPAGHDRPWARAAPQAATGPAEGSASRDATPDPGDLHPDD